MTLHPIALAVLGLAALTGAARADGLRRPYIVQLSDQPVASYGGELAGLTATQPAPGQRLDLAAGSVQLYSNYLNRKQAAVKSVVAAAPILYDYSVVLNGFAALLTDDEVRQLRARDDVAAITADEPRRLLTSYTPTFLGLDKPDGLWAALGGMGGAGDGVVVGVVDGGVWPESPSYADWVDANGAPSFDPAATLAYGAPPAHWQGLCQSGEGFAASHCNNKLIGARFFNATYLSDKTKVTHWTEFVSPRDSVGGTIGHGGHGTHTSSTAAGNHGVLAAVGGVPMGATSGMAPRARVAIYKVCWSYNDSTDATGAGNSCWGGDSVAAIEQAIKDGVHVLNYSISGGATVSDPVEQAFLHAANAGVFVAASAGNAGPANAVAHISPWLTTVAASSHNRLLQASVALGNGASYTGASLNMAALPWSALIRAEDAGVAGANPSLLSLCYSMGSNNGVRVLDPAKVAGKVVTCTRGSNPRVDKSLAVLEAGGAGMIMLDNGAGLVAEAHSVPTVHVSQADGAVIGDYARGAGARAAISTFVAGASGVPAPTIASFSSRGPNMYDANLLKPDLSAPGVDILAGVTPELSKAERAAVQAGGLAPPPAWNFYQGTSMSSPHVAGIGALLRQAHPDWSPAAIKSALMTTGNATYDDGLTGLQNGKLPWSQGAGHLNPNAALDPGLVYDAGPADYKRYQCGAGIASECGAGTIPGYNLNLASITAANVMGALTVTRSVTNVGAASATYRAAASLSGYEVAVSPATLTLAPGASAAFSVTLTRTTAPDNVWQYGALNWSDGVHNVRSPLQARSGQPVVAPDLLQSDRAGASRALTLQTGFAGKLGAAPAGLKEATTTATTIGRIRSGSANTTAQVQALCASGGTGTRVVSVNVPADAVVARFETNDRDTTGGGGQDLDLALLDGANRLVGYSGNDGSNELITLTSPAAGTYKVCAVGYALTASQINFTLTSWVVTRADSGGNLKATLPSKVIAGGNANVAVSWSGLATGKRYLGGFQWLDAGGAAAATTVVLVETNGAVPLAQGVPHRSDAERGL